MRILPFVSTAVDMMAVDMIAVTDRGMSI